MSPPLPVNGMVLPIKDGREKAYLTLTDKGFKYIEKYRLISGFIDEFEL